MLRPLGPLRFALLMLLSLMVLFTTLAGTTEIRLSSSDGGRGISFGTEWVLETSPFTMVLTLAVVIALAVVVVRSARHS